MDADVDVVDVDGLRLAPTVGIVACLAVLVTLGIPYVLADSATSVGAYYGSGVVNPLVAGLFALVGLIIFAAGREGRTDPGMAAGAGLALGLFTTIVALAWALTARVDAAAVVTYHRWLLTGVAFVIPISAGWFARSLGVM